jgi:diaminohydroxyphosphoribosylaminopyrimidine deaminase/5-amino-6-(5-phosphoribosylamino)uracil reductase
MKRAIQLAKKGRMTVSPNPMVGAVVVKDGKVIGEGFHLKKGESHAEVNALNSAHGSVEGATLYCTLEPCCHTKKTTPPCTDFIIEKKIKRVVVACLDPNPEVSGKGIEKLKSAGINIDSGILENEASDLNKVFFKNMKSGLPYIHLKAALTLDGRMCSSSGNSKWISSQEARDEVHYIRESYDSVMIGRKTLLADNPKLTARREGRITKNLKKIIVGNLSEEEIKLDLFKDKGLVLNLYSAKTCFKGKKIKLHFWEEALKDLYQDGICSILVEGGSSLLTSLIEQNHYDEATFYMTKKLVGNGKSLFESDIIKDMKMAKALNGSWRLNASGEAILEVKN